MKKLKIVFFIATKLLSKNSKKSSNTIVGISIASVALGIAILIVSFAVSDGFSNQLKEKIVGFCAHIQISHLDNNNSYESMPISQKVINEISNIPNVKKMQVSAAKAGIIRANEHIEGILFKGVEKDYNFDFYHNFLVKGRIPDYEDTVISNQILISKLLADKLLLDTGDKIHAYFIQNPVRERVFTVAGIYNTGFGDFDKTFALCHLKHIQKLNRWNSDQVGEIEVLLDDFDAMDKTAKNLNDALPYDYLAMSAKERFPEIFSWIKLFEQNVIILIVLIVLIASVSLISTQLTLFLEHIPTIGILKAMGCQNATIGNVFVVIMQKIMLWGLLLGNLTGIALCLVQQHWHCIKLNPEHYYIAYVPIEIQIGKIVLINVFALIISVIVLVFPAWQFAKTTNLVDALRKR